jgi:uncharacterized protein YjiS (DUF1127 family)
MDISSIELLDSAGRRRSSLVASLTRLIASIMKERNIRRDVDHLQALDDRLLADIGLDRGSLEHVVRYGRFCPSANERTRR